MRDSLSPSESVCLARSWAFVQSRFDPEVVWRRFTNEVLATDVPLFTDLFSQRLRGDRLTLRSRVGRRAGLLTDAVTEGETCLLRFCGREIRLPLAVWPALQFATTTDEFAVQDLPDCLDGEGKLTLVTRLVREGVSPAELGLEEVPVTEQTFHAALVWAVFAMAVLTFANLMRLTAPYGRHYSGRGWGPEMSNQAGWVVMELPATALFAGIYFMGGGGKRAGSPSPSRNLAMPLPEPDLRLPSSHENRRQENADYGRGQRVRLQRGQRVRQCALHLGVCGIRRRVAGRSAVSGWAGHLRGRLGPERPFRQHPARPAQTRPNRLFHPARRGIPLRLLPQLSGGVAGMVRVGGGNVVAGRTRVLHLHSGQPRPESTQPPPVVPGTVRKTIRPGGRP